jgi:CHAT domain-containing protein
MATCLNRLGSYYQSLSLSKNIDNYVQEVLPDNSFLKAEVYRLMGESYLNLGRNERALELLLRSEQLYPANSELKLSEAYNLMGIIYWNNANQELALQYHNRALELRERLLGKESLPVADSYNNIGLVYMDSDGLQAGIYFNRTLKTYESAYGTMHPKVAFCMINIARAYTKRGLYNQAKETIEKVMYIWNQLYTDDHPNKAFTLSTLGQVYEAESDLSEALHQQELALQMYLRILGNKHPDVANTYFLIAEIFNKQSDYKEALHAYQNAIYANLINQSFITDYDLPQIKEYLNPDYLLSAMIGKAQLLELMHYNQTLKARDLMSALDTYQLADSLITQIRQIRVTENDKLRLGEISRLAYEKGISISMTLADLPFQKARFQRVALQFCEQSKSAVLQEAIRDTNAKSFAGIPQSELQLEDSLEQEIAYYIQKSASGENIESNRSKLFAYQTALRNHIQYLENKFPRYFELKYANKPFSPEEVQAVLDDHTAIVSYFEARESLYQFVITKEKINVHSIVKADEFRKLNGFRNALKFNIQDIVEALSYELHEVLIPSIPKDITHLVIIPDGVLNTIPFEALKSIKTRKYLIEDYSISYDYSIQLWIERNQRLSNPSSKLLALAPISFDGVLSTLPGTENELMQIRQLFRSNGKKVKIHTGSEAYEGQLKNNDLTTYKYIHLATHGKVNESKPELSRIYLSPDDENDGILYSGDIYNLNVNAELVSLSACETGLGKLSSGEGVVGLARSLMYAGATNLLVSLWQVSDESTANLMIGFYQQHLLDGQNTFHQALRKAKLELISSEKYQNPFYWSPFILVGK